MAEQSTINNKPLTIYRRGYIALISFLIISAMVLSVSIALALFGVSEAQMGLSEKRGQSAFALAEGCIEDALLSAYYDADYAGGARNCPEGSCTIGVVKDNDDWTITVEGATSGHTKRVEVTISRGDKIVVTGWREIE